MADFRHISKALSQINKTHKGTSRGRSVGGKIESRNIMTIGSTQMSSQGKEQRFNSLNEQRKNKREEMLMKRRGLNFVTEHHEELLDQDVIQMCETELDNVAPKVVALLSLSEDCDTAAVRLALVEHCLMYQEGQKKADKRRSKEEILETEETGS